MPLVACTVNNISHPCFSLSSAIRRFLPGGLLTLACLLTGAACAKDLPIGNPGFEEWRAGKNVPESWNLMTAVHTLDADCQIAREGKCSLRLASNPQTPVGGMTTLAQTLVASTVGGHPLHLSGWIKTRDVVGKAVLLMQVDSKVKTAVAEAILGKGAPDGSKDWQRFDIQVPVAANARSVHIGLGLIGSGTAWFDDVKLDIDESVKIADIAEVRPAPRPQKSSVLADDNTLALPPGLTPDIRPEWKTGVRQDARHLRSLFSEDFSDLQFLKPLLKGKRLVQLGESGHGYAEFNWMKVRLIKFLHQEMGFDVIAMESSMSTCDAVDKEIVKSSAAEAMRNCLFATIGTDETADLFSYIKQSKGNSGARHPLILAGFDNQSSSAISTAVITARFKSLLSQIDSPLVTEIDGMEQELQLLFTPKQDTTLSGRLAARYRLVAETLASNREKLLTLGKTGQAEVDMSLQEAWSRVAYCEMQPYPYPQIQGTEIRDKAMADNLNVLLDRIYPDKKIIVWAHNTHIAHHWNQQHAARTTGVWMAEKRRQDIYTIGMYMGRGVTGIYGRDSYSAIAAPEADSLEAILANAGKRWSFIDFSQAKPGPAHDWMFKPVNARYWGSSNEQIIPARAYDAVIYIDEVTPSVYPG